MSSVRITGLAATLLDQYGNTLVVEWDGRYALLSVYPADTSDGPSVSFQPGQVAELYQLLGSMLGGQPPEVSR